MPRTSKQVRGDWGEALAETFLQGHGYAPVARNWRCKAGEIDLIMRTGKELVFVEVRLRARTSFGAGLETVAWQKQQKLIRAAQWYLQSTDQLHLPARFDVISIVHDPGHEPEIQHIEYAFGVN